jgi:hypothetical protein
MGRLKGKTSATFRKVLLAAFKEDDLRLLMSDRLDEDWEHIVRDGNLKSKVHDAIEWAEDQRRVTALLEAAVAERPSNPDIRKFRDEHVAEFMRADNEEVVPGPIVKSPEKVNLVLLLLLLSLVCLWALMYSNWGLSVLASLTGIFGLPLLFFQLLPSDRAENLKEWTWQPILGCRKLWIWLAGAFVILVVFAAQTATVDFQPCSREMEVEVWKVGPHGERGQPRTLFIPKGDSARVLVWRWTGSKVELGLPDGIRAFQTDGSPAPAVLELGPLERFRIIRKEEAGDQVGTLIVRPSRRLFETVGNNPRDISVTVGGESKTFDYRGLPFFIGPERTLSEEVKGGWRKHMAGELPPGWERPRSEMPVVASAALDEVEVRLVFPNGGLAEVTAPRDIGAGSLKEIVIDVPGQN